MNNKEKTNKLRWFIDNFEEVAGAFLLTSTVLLLFTQVIFRYVIGKSIPWTEELSRFTFLGLVYMAASLAAKKRAHVRVTAQFKILPVKAQNFMIMLSDSVYIAFCSIVIWQGFLLYQGMGQYPLVSPVLDWNLKYLFLVIPFSFALQIARIVEGYYLWFKSGCTVKLIVEEGEDVENVT